MGFADDIADLLSTQGFADATIFRGDLPERPDLALCVTPTAGFGSVHTFGSTVGLAPEERLRFQVRARALTYAAAESLIDAAHSKLDGLRQKGINGRLYQWITAAATPLYVGQDDEGRPLFACNYLVSRSQDT